MRNVGILRVMVLAAVVLTAGAHASFANCLEFGGFAIFQCANRAYFSTIPDFDPNTYQSVDPNTGEITIQNVSAVFWQIGFGNQSLNNGGGSGGTGISGVSTFNGNDQGQFAPDIRDARAATGDPNVPLGAVCFSSNNWGNSGVDGCCDNDRTTSLMSNKDDTLNPYYDVYLSAYGPYYQGIYSLDWQQDYPMAVLLKNQDNKFFAFAAVSTLNRGNTGGGVNGPCAATPGANPAPCDFRPGFFDFRDVKNGITNPSDGGRLNIVPWQATPDPNIISNVPVDPNDPNSNRVLNLAWSSVTVYSDQSVRPSTSPSMGGATCTSPGCTGTTDATRAPGVGVADISGKFGGLVRFVVETASQSDPNFLTPLSMTETTNTSLNGVNIPFGACVRIRTLFGKKAETSTISLANCRLGKCGDVGYEIASPAKCVGASVCTATGPEICDGIDNDCNGQVDEGNPGGGASCSTGLQGVCSAGTTTCQSGSLQCIQDTASSAETCDGLDNNCNGTVDEGNPGGGASCSTGLLGVCAAGTQTCTGGALVCAQNVQSSQEVCNNLDDNCDGTVDSFQTSCGVGQCGSTGTCTAGSDNCTPLAPSTEVCNNLDDNCDGFVDNIAGVACGTGQLGVCASGLTGCQAGSQVCVPVTIASPEICDGLDNDCNGSTDDNPMLGQCGIGLCQATATCTGGVETCVPGTPMTEICNMLDDNCDGTVDNLPPTPEICDLMDNDCNGIVDDVDPNGPPCTLFVTFPIAGDSLDCSDPLNIQPTITWAKGQYDKFKVSISTTSTFAKGTVKTSGKRKVLTDFWQVKKKAWKAICAKVLDGDPIFVKIDGIDINVLKSDPLRKFTSPVAMGTVSK